MGDLCWQCGLEMDDADYIKEVNCWLCPHCLVLNPNCDGRPTILDKYIKERNPKEVAK